MTDHDQTAGGRARPETSARQTATLVLIALLAVALIAFIVQNSDLVEVSWFGLEGRQPLWLLLVITTAIGAVLARLVPFVWRRQRQRQTRRQPTDVVE